MSSNIYRGSVVTLTVPESQAKIKARLRAALEKKWSGVEFKFSLHPEGDAAHVALAVPPLQLRNSHNAGLLADEVQRELESIVPVLLKETS